MSKSRLEKFLYALYSLDSSDLPNPLSRIEQLYKCWVTGEEAPTFEPLSRVEKYLMAILGVYDVDSLPNPLSRVEVLLYKLVTGDDSLEDFDTFLSEHEELLAEIIRNGGAGGNIDIEYVLHTLSTGYNTLYNTAEKPVKSAILKGNTIVSHYSSDIIELTANGSWVERPVQLTEVTLPVKPSTDYLFVVEIIENSLIGDETINNSLRFGETEDTGRFPAVFTSISAIPLHHIGMYSFILTTKANISGIDIFDRKQLSKHCTGGKIKFRYMVIEYQQGMENWDIPDFEGMRSVKMPVLTTTGKNLLDTESLVEGYYWTNTGDAKKYEKSMLSEQYIRVEPSTHIYFSFPNVQVLSYDINKKFINRTQCNAIPYLVTDGVAFIRLSFYNTETYDKNIMVTIETNILTINEEVELRGIGEAKDELNLLTGELTERIGEVVLNGSEKWRINDDQIYIKNTDFLTLPPAHLPNSELIRDSDVQVNTGNNYMLFIRQDDLPENIRQDNNTTTLSNWNAYLQQNPITVQYQLKTESIKTVDLSIVDQDGNDTKLSTFNDITYVTLSSEGLMPEVELKVATKNK